MIIGTFSGPPAPIGGSSSANEYSTVQELLYKMPDNTANLIQAKDVRDSVYTLWQRISSVQVTASQSASASVIYSNSLPTPNTVGGIPAGSTFSERTMKQMWDALLYPYIAPAASLAGGFTREYGDSNAITLNWSVTKRSESITTIVVDGTPVSPTGNNQSGTKSTTVPQNINTTFTMTVSDIPNGSSTVNATTAASWTNRRYWGTLPVGHVLTTVSSLPFAHANISALSSDLNGGQVNGSGFIQTRTISTNFDYVVFIFPHNSVNFSTNPPRVSIGGFGNNNWIKTRSNVQFTNQFGYTGTNYDVWIFGNTQAPNTFTYVIS
jgi:hypothetical protein